MVMSEYDNTNRGAVFTPFEDQKFILQGKLDIQGKEYPVVVMQMTSRNGGKRLEIYQKMGTMFDYKKNEGSENQPDYDGPLDLIDGNLKIAGWRQQADGKPYLSLQVSERLAKTEETPPQELKPATTEIIVDDDIPF